jgi:hypothetical protein
MQAIKPGMNRHQLLTLFKSDGGISTRMQAIFVSRDCPYFKVEVEFRLAKETQRDAQGGIPMNEDRIDVIEKTSRPYLEFPVVD